MCSPVRLEMIELMRVAGPCSIRDLADEMDRPADSLYHHLRLLLKAGLFSEVGSRKSGRRNEAVYDLTAEVIQPDYDPATGRNAPRMARVVGSVARASQRNLVSALKKGEMSIEGGKRDLWMNFEAAWLDEKRLAQLNKHIAAISELFSAARASGLSRAKGAKLRSITLFSCPVVRSGRRAERE